MDSPHLFALMLLTCCRGTEPPVGGKAHKACAELFPQLQSLAVDSAQVLQHQPRRQLRCRVFAVLWLKVRVRSRWSLAELCSKQ